MILSSAQTVLAGALFAVNAHGAAAPLGTTTIAPYAAFGAFYFLVSGVWLPLTGACHRPSRAAA